MSNHNHIWLSFLREKNGKKHRWPPSWQNQAALEAKNNRLGDNRHVTCLIRLATCAHGATYRVASKNRSPSAAEKRRSTPRSEVRRQSIPLLRIGWNAKITPYAAEILHAFDHSTISILWFGCSFQIAQAPPKKNWPARNPKQCWLEEHKGE